MKDNISKDIGFIIIHRKLQDNWLWMSEPFSKAQAWIDLLFLANHKDSSFFLRGARIEVKRGHLARSEESLSERWKWSREKLRNFLKLLETEQQIRQHKSNIIKVIEIINYNSFQKPDNKLDKKKTTNQTTNQTHTINDNNDNNENKIKIPDFIDLELWNDFVKMRKEMKKPLTETSYKQNIQKLTEFENKKSGNANEALKNAIAGNWQGLFEPKTFQQSKSNSTADTLRTWASKE